MAFAGSILAIPISGANWFAINTKIPMQYQMGIPISMDFRYFTNNFWLVKNERKLLCFIKSNDFFISNLDVKLLLFCNSNRKGSKEKTIGKANEKEASCSLAEFVILESRSRLEELTFNDKSAKLTYKIAI